MVPRFSWSDDHTVLVMDSYPILVQNFPRMIQRLINDAEKQLEILMDGFKLPELDENIDAALNPKDSSSWFKDDLRRIKKDYCFITDSRNDLLKYQSELKKFLMNSTSKEDPYAVLDLSGTIRMNQSEFMYSNNRQPIKSNHCIL